jgi:hypothetical protein
MPRTVGNETKALKLLSLFESGMMTVEVEGYPLLKLNGDEKSLEVEAQGLKESGLRITEFLSPEKRRMGIREMIKDSEEFARELSIEGWTVTLYDRGKDILRIGRKAPKLTGHIEFNPLRFREILDDL